MPRYPELFLDDTLIDRKMYFRDGVSNKEYWVTIARAASDGEWVVVGSWGRRGRVNQCKRYLRTPNRAAAMNEANALLDGKLGRGYKDAHGGYPPAFSSWELDGGWGRTKEEAEEPEPAEPVAVLDIAEALFG